MEYLAKGGRCSSVAAFGANLLQLKLCIYVKNGAMRVGKKYRGKYRKILLNNFADRSADGDDICPDRVFVPHAGCDHELIESVAQAVKNTLHFKEVLVTRAGYTISSHCGANTLGALFIRKAQQQWPPQKQFSVSGEAMIFNCYLGNGILYGQLSTPSAQRQPPQAGWVLPIQSS